MNGNFFTICSAFFSLMLTIVYFSKERLDNKETEIYQYMIIVNILTGIFAILSFISIKYSPYKLLTDILNKSLYILYTTWLFLFTMYIFSISLKFQERNLEKQKILKGISLAIYTIFVILVILSPINYVNTARAVYPYGTSTTLLFFVAFVCVLVWLYSGLINYKNIRSKKYIPLFIMIVVGLIVIIIQKTWPELLLLTSMISYVTFIMYFTIENPDVKLIQVLNEAKLSAEKANRAKSDFLSNMSHEIRTPLNAIVGFSDCILEEENLEDAKSDAKDIKLASENLLEIVNGILDISKIEADKMEIVETDYNILEVLDNVSKLVKPRIGDKPIEFNTKFASDVPYIVHGDGGKLRQILTNLLTNAIKYTESGSIAFLVNCVNDNEYTKLIISVEDTGRGINPDQINKLFNKFERLDEDKNTTLEGTGLGLAITKRFVEMMGGKIVVQSKYGEGSKFTVYLRQRIVTMHKPENMSDEELINTANLTLFDFTSARVLVVDDNKINLKVALKLLSNYGIKAEASESGFDAIDRLNRGEIYDLILLDDMMPKMSGVETLKKIRESIIYDMPVVALTANALSGMKEKYITDGFDDYLAKPIEKNELYQILVKYLNVKTAQLPILKEEKEEINSKSVLIVDDNKLNIKIATKLLNDKNLIIDSALSGSEAIEKSKGKKYDLILMDIMMPEMDGVETMHHIKEDLNFDNPIIAVTADAVEGSKEKYLNEGFDYYVAKPINNDIIDKILSKFLH